MDPITNPPAPDDQDGAATRPDLWPERVGSVTIEDLVGTPEWLDLLAELPAHDRLAKGLRFKVWDVTEGEGSFAGDFGNEVPTAAVLAQRFPKGGTFVVRASKRRATKGGGNLTEVRLTVAPRERSGRGLDSDAIVARVLDVALGRLTDAKPARDETSKALNEVKQFVGLAVQAMAPHLPKVVAILDRLSTDEGVADATTGGVVKVVKDSGLLASFGRWIDAKIAGSKPADAAAAPAGATSK